jgi:hypothetical protein
MDKVIAMLKGAGLDPRLTYNRHHIATGTTGYNFLWFHPRKSAGHCHIEFRTAAETRDSVLSELQNNGIDVTPRRAENITISLSQKLLENHTDAILSALKDAEKASRV